MLRSENLYSVVGQNWLYYAIQYNLTLFEDEDAITYNYSFLTYTTVDSMSFAVFSNNNYNYYTLKSLSLFWLAEFSKSAPVIWWARPFEQPTSVVNNHLTFFFFVNVFFFLLKRVKEIVEYHDPEQPLFLYMAFQNVHNPIQAPEEYVHKYDFINQRMRRVHAGMVDIMDEAVGNITKAFKDKG